MEIKPLASGSNGNAYLVKNGTTRLLLDCGITIKQIQIACNFKLPKYCLLSHEHGDHSKAATKLAELGVEIYASKGTIEALGLEGKRRFNSLPPLTPTRMGGCLVLPVPLEHDAAEPFGYVLTFGEGKRLLYITDTHYLRYRITGITHLMIECNYSNSSIDEAIREGRTNKALARRIYGSHMSLDNLLSFFQANNLRNLRQVYLLHLSNSNSNEQEIWQAVARATGAEVIVC